MKFNSLLIFEFEIEIFTLSFQSDAQEMQSKRDLSEQYSWRRPVGGTPIWRASQFQPDDQRYWWPESIWGWQTAYQNWY